MSNLDAGFLADMTINQCEFGFGEGGGGGGVGPHLKKWVNP